MGAKKAAVVFALSLVPFADGAPALNGYLQHQGSHAMRAARFHSCIAGAASAKSY
jgi:hypothetical protein